MSNTKVVSRIELIDNISNNDKINLEINFSCFALLFRFQNFAPVVEYKIRMINRISSRLMYFYGTN